MAITRTSYRVIYGDTDQMGVVYYANYLRWFEMGRAEFLREVGIPYTTIEERELYFPVIEVSGRYLRPARFDDKILIETTLDSLGGAMLRFNYKIYHQTDGSLLTTGWTKHACVDSKGQVTQIPSDFRAELSEHVSEITKRGRHRPQS